MTKYRIIVDMYENKSESRMEWEFESPLLCSLENISDELVIKQGKLRIIKKIGITEYNKYFVKAIPEEFDVELTATKNIVFGFEDTILLFQGVNYISIENLKSDIFIQYIINSPFTDGLAMQSDLKAELAIKNAEISAKVSKNEIISEINLSPEVAKIQAEKIKLEGYTTINGGFSVDLQGNMSCQDATINGGLVVGTGLYSCLVFRPTQSLEILNDIQTIAGLQKTGYASYIAGFSNVAGRLPVLIPYKLPNNFTIVKAEVLVEHQSVNWVDIQPSTGSPFTVNNARVKDLNLFANTMPPNTTTSVPITMFSGVTQANPAPYLTIKVTNAWGNGSDDYNFGNGYQTKTTIDIKSYLEGLQEGVVGLAPKVETITDNEVLLWQSTALMSGTLYIYGMLGRE